MYLQGKYYILNSKVMDRMFLGYSLYTMQHHLENIHHPHKHSKLAVQFDLDNNLRCKVHNLDLGLKYHKFLPSNFHMCSLMKICLLHKHGIHKFLSTCSLHRRNMLDYFLQKHFDSYLYICYQYPC